MDFETICCTTESFCAKASLDFESSLELVRGLRNEASERDRLESGWIPEDGDFEGDEELTVAEDEEWPLIESYQLVGLFALVLLAVR
jgi:hypothetical protein